MKKRLMIFAFIMIFILSGCNNRGNSINIKLSNKAEKLETKNKQENEKELKLNILVNNKFLYKCVKDIDGGKHNVDYIFEKRNKENIVRHYYDLSYVPDLFIYDEFNFTKLNSKYISKIEGNKVGIINASRGINSLSNYKNVSAYGKQRECLFWNNIDNYKVVLVNIKNAIVERDPKNRSYYEKNFNELLKSLEPDEKFFSEKSKCAKEYTFITEDSYLNSIMAYSGLQTISISPDVYNLDKLSESKEKNKDVNKEKKEKIEDIDLEKIINEKCKNKDKIIFIYYNDAFFKDNERIISQFNIKCIKTNNINCDIQYGQLIEYEKKLFNAIVNICTNGEI